MKTAKAIQVKAVLLFILFSINTVLGFACSIGVNLGYNKYHHKKEVCSSCMHSYKKQTKENQNDCCSHVVTPFNLLSKIVPSSYHLVPMPDSFLISAFNLFLQPSLVFYNYLFIITSYYSPPAENIRIFLQSFLI